jgi:hypothetical protein
MICCPRLLLPGSCLRLPSVDYAETLALEQHHQRTASRERPVPEFLPQSVASRNGFTMPCALLCTLCRFHLFGSPIALSKSPAMHNAAFARRGLPHTYSLHETTSAEEAVAVLKVSR